MKYALANSLSSAVSGLDPDAKAYIAAVEAADAQALESGVKVAINNFVKGCKSDAIWDAIKASCILAGARTLSGALVPLRGTAPTNFNFVSGDYNRKTGLVGDGATKYLDSNRANDSDPQNSHHFSVNATTVQTSGVLGYYIGSRLSTTEYSQIGRSGVNPNNTIATSRSSSSTGSLAGTNFGGVAGFHGVVRSESANIIIRGAGTNLTLASTSVSPNSRNTHIFKRNSDDTQSPTDARLSFYSIGESLNLALLDSRVSTLMTSINSAIP